MYIAPNSTIYLLGGINWTPAYTDAVYFNNKTVQLNYMKNKIKRKFESQSYQRHSKNVLRILASADSLYDCNYLMFQNRFRSGTLGDKWFYAFIIDIEYVNENTADVYYEIDVIQTWFWDLKLGQCFVEREIPRYDTLYGNLVPEDLETGDFTSNAQSSFDLNETSVVMSLAKVYDPDSGEYSYPSYANDNYKYGEINDIFSPLAFIRADKGNNEDFTLFYNTIKSYVDDGQADNIVNIQFVPKFVVNGMKYAEDPSSSTHYNKEEFTIRRLERLGGTGGYFPKNKKLYTYPYCSLNVSNQQGQIKEYKWEDFEYTLVENTPQIKFNIYGIFYSNPCVMAVPHGYKNILGDAYDYGVTLTNFPPAPWICDTYKAYLAQNKASIATSILCDVVGGALGISTNINKAIGNQAVNNNVPNSMPVQQITSEMGRNAGVISGIGALANIGLNIGGTLAKISDARNLPNKVANLNQTDAFQLVINNVEITFTQMTIKPEMAKIIDDYFSAYGYAQHKFKKPEIIARTYWGYTKTKGCELIGSCPEGIKAQIASIFDNGIRFWNSNEIIGDYSLDNSRPRAESEGN